MSSASEPTASPAAKARAPTCSISAATRRAARRTARRASPGERGFTLIEVLVVALIIGLTVALVAVKLQPDERQVLRDEALRLSALLMQARDEAITSGTSVAWRGDPAGYGFLRRTVERTWQPVTDDTIFRRRELRTPLTLTAIEIGGRPAANEDVIIFSSTGVAPPFRITLGLNAERLAVRADHPTRIEIDDGTRR